MTELRQQETTTPGMRARRVKLSPMANILLQNIREQLDQAESFSREDLLQLRSLRHVATITRYRYICLALHELLAGRCLVTVSRTELAVRGAKQSAEPVHVRYAETLNRLIGKFNLPFAVMDVVDAWTTDSHLTVNTKRVAARVHLKALRAGGQVKANGDYTYTRKGDLTDA